MMKSFSLNSKKKKDVEKQKKLAEEEACAEAYEEFVATFEAPKSQSKVFVRGNVINASSGEELNADQSGKYYKPKKLEEFEKQKSKDTKKNDHKKQHQQQSHHSPHHYNEKPAKKKAEVKRKSVLETFKEELRRQQEERHKQRSHGGKEKSKSSSFHDDDHSNNNNNYTSDFKKGSHDTGDPDTTNIYLGNLNPKLTENQLCEIFGRYGPLASVKIMWPRSEEERVRNRNCGFVAFMCRKDGERALKYINGRVIMGYEMKLGWGKAIPIPSTPIYIPPALRELTQPPPQSGLPFNAQIVDEKDKELLLSYGNDPQKLYREDKKTFDELLSRTFVKVVIPEDRALVFLIHRVIEFVVREGPLFEALLMNREMNNPAYAFLFENQSPAHIYYRWRLFSVLQGDHPSRWRTEEFRMFSDGSVWRPPPLNFFEKGMPEELLPDEDNFKDEWNDQRSPTHSTTSYDDEDSNHKSRGHLRKERREELEDMLRSLNPQRSKIGNAMVFCINHADCWEEIVECITDSLCIIETPLYKKMARLFLVSDILHNCSVKVSNVSNFRKGFQSKLEDIFESFQQVYNQIEGRLKAEHFKQRVMNCFRAWEDSAIFSPDFLIKLQNIFLGLTMGKKDKLPIATKSPAKNAEDIDGVPIIDHDGHDGTALSDQQADHQKDDPFRKKFKTSKWETVDPEQDESRFSSKWESTEKSQDAPFDGASDADDQDDDRDGQDDEDIDGKPMDEDEYLDSLIKAERDKKTNGSSNDQPNPNLSRDVLRDIELQVVKYQDKLESNVRTGKVKLDLYQSISTEVEQYRKQLLKEASDQVRRNARSKSRSRSRSPKSSRHSSKRRSKSKSPKRRR